MYTIRLENTITHQIYEQQVQDNNNGEKLYFRFGVSTFDLVDGEYILNLLNAEGDVLAEDLMRIGDYNPEALQYSKGENTYIDVTLNAVLQAEKYVTITEIQTRIVPDLGNDAIETVYVDAQPLYDSARSEGYDEGYAEGEKASYNTGYEQGQTDIAANARVLEVTENGNYLSKFSEPIIPPFVTGMYDDGSEFYSYATIRGSVFDTGIPATQDSKIEFWWKNDATNSIFAAILGGQTFEGYIFKFAEYRSNTYRIEYGNYKVGKLFEYNFTYDMTSQWNHIIFSKKDGLYINGELICEVQGEVWAENEIIPNFWINAAYLEEVHNNANGTFGMIKINDTTIIPTSDGFLNVNTGKLLEIVQDGDYTYTESLAKYGEGELYKTINVNVVPKINVAKEGIKFAYSPFKEIPEWVDFDGVTSFSYMFYNCNNLITIPQLDTSNVTNMGWMFYNCNNLQTIPQLDTSNVTNMGWMFYNCRNLQTIPQLDTSNVTDMNNMFYNCRNLQTIPQLDTSNVTDMNNMFYYCSSLITIPEMDTSNVTNMRWMFSGCYNLQTIPQLDTSNVTDMGRMFSSCYNLQTIPQLDTSNVTDMDRMFSNCDNLQTIPQLDTSNVTDMSWMLYGCGNVTDVGGWKNLKINWNDNYGLRACPNLTYQSCINILNGLYDFVGNGSTETRTLKVNSNFLTTVGDEISIGTNKGWTITA